MAMSAALGTEKVRLTGGELSLRRDFVDIATVRKNPAFRTLAVTTPPGKYELEKSGE